MTIQTWLLATVAAGLAAFLAFCSGISSMSISATPVEGNASALLLMVLLGALSIGSVYLVWLITENRTTFTLNLSNKSEKS